MGTKASSAQRVSVAWENRAVGPPNVAIRPLSAFPIVGPLAWGGDYCRRGGPAITRDEGPVHTGAKVLIQKAQRLGAMKGFFA